MADMQKVASSNIDSIGYDKNTCTLYVQFLSGGLYKAADVDEGVFDRFKLAKSKGAFFAKEIKSSYKVEKVS
jgi:hypothetical protein